MKFYENHSLSLVSTFGIGGKARFFVIPENEEALLDSVCMARSFGRYKVIGNASNLLFDDRGFDGAVISTVRLRSLGLIEKPETLAERAVYKRHGSAFIKAQCGAMLPALSAFTARGGITGFEGLCSIPATVGGALCQNAGAYGSEISDTLIAYEVFLPEVRQKRLVFADKSGFSYRKSSVGKSGEIVVCAYFEARSGDVSEIQRRVERSKAYRVSSQPIGARSAGSYFRRPPINEGVCRIRGKSAGELIDLCGLKGERVGGAEVSVKHANFIINKSGHATASDVLRLAKKVKKAVYRSFRVRLTEEVELVKRR